MTRITMTRCGELLEMCIEGYEARTIQRVVNHYLSLDYENLVISYDCDDKIAETRMGVGDDSDHNSSPSHQSLSPNHKIQTYS